MRERHVSDFGDENVRSALALLSPPFLLRNILEESH